MAQMLFLKTTIVRQHKWFIRNSHFITQDVRKTCTQRLRFNMTSNTDCFIEATLGEPSMVSTVSTWWWRTHWLPVQVGITAHCLGLAKMPASFPSIAFVPSRHNNTVKKAEIISLWTTWHHLEYPQVPLPHLGKQPSWQGPSTLCAFLWPPSCLRPLRADFCPFGLRKSPSWLFLSPSSWISALGQCSELSVGTPCCLPFFPGFPTTTPSVLAFFLIPLPP